MVAILAIYLDLLIGLPCRLLGGVFGTLGKGQVAKIEKEIDSVMDEQMKVSPKATAFLSFTSQ